MAIKKRIRLEDLGIEQETPAERHARIAAYQNGAQSRLDRIDEREAREDARLRRIEQKVKSGELWLDMKDLMSDIGPVPMIQEDFVPQPKRGRQLLTEQFPTNHDTMVMQELYTPPPHSPQKGKTLPAGKLPHRQSLGEQVAPIQKKSGLPWSVQQFIGETRSGDQVPVWKIVNRKTGRSLDKLFRLEEVAQRVSQIINETGDPGDPRAVSLIAAYDKRDKLIKEARQLEKSADGKPMKTERLRAIRAEVNQLNYRLGI